MILSLGVISDEVGRLNEKLLGVKNSRFSQQTFQAVVYFQKKNDLVPDGVVGPKTWDLLFPKEPLTIPKIAPPASRDELYRIFGDPLVSNYQALSESILELPGALQSQLKIKHISCHKFVAENLKGVLNEIVTRGLADSLVSFDGCWCLRYIRGSSSVLSIHSWGLAVDFNAKTNALGTVGDMDPKIVQVFEQAGWYWGGNFTRKDPMHFQWTSKPI